MSKYPYIGKSRVTPNVVLFTSRLRGFCLRSGNHSIGWNEEAFDDVTNVFLSGKKIEVNSPFQSKLIQLAAFKAGGETRTGGKSPINRCIPFILISKDLQVTFEDNRSFFDAHKMDGIKLPRFDNPPEFVFPELEYPIKHFDCVCAKCGGRCCIGNCDEWPKVGDEAILIKKDYGVTHGAEAIGKKVKVMSLFKDGDLDMAAIKHGITNYCFRVDMLSKPKTPDQELNDELCELFLTHCGSKFQASEIARKLMNEYNITKKVKDND